jgi:hypothetical protein
MPQRDGRMRRILPTDTPRVCVCSRICVCLRTRGRGRRRRRQPRLLRPCLLRGTIRCCSTSCCCSPSRSCCSPCRSDCSGRCRRASLLSLLSATRSCSTGLSFSPSLPPSSSRRSCIRRAPRTRSCAFGKLFLLHPPTALPGVSPPAHSTLITARNARSSSSSASSTSLHVCVCVRACVCARVRRERRRS